MAVVFYKDECLIYARDTKEIETFVKILRDEYKLTMNDPDPIDYLLGTNVSHKYNG
jgi:hypothetical protein